MLGRNARLVLDFKPYQNQPVLFIRVVDKHCTLFFYPLRIFAQDSGIWKYIYIFFSSLWPSNDGNINGVQMVV